MIRGAPCERAADRGGNRGVDRAVSTVLDAAVFLLLVSAAIGLLYTVPQSGDGTGADPDVAAEATTTLATTTATIEYAPAPDGNTIGDTATRTDRGTVAELLAETTVANARLAGEPFTRAPNHETVVRDATRRAIASFDGAVEIQVRTQWRPLPGSGFRSGLIVGPSPPDDADVHAATVAVPVDSAAGTAPATTNWTLPADGDGADNADDGENASPSISGEPRHSLSTVAADGGCDDLARTIAVRTVGAVFPPERTNAALLAGGDVTDATEHRYTTAASAAPLDAVIVPDEANARTRNALLAQALTDRFETTACEGYDDIATAANRAAPSTVTVSIRTWSS